MCLSRYIGTSCGSKLSTMKNKRCGPDGGRGDPRLITGSKGDPPVICDVRGDPPWVYGSRGDPPLLLSTRGDPAIFEARGDPPEIETRGDPPEIKCTRDGPFLRWLVFNSIGCQNGPHGRGMPENECPLPNFPQRGKALASRERMS